MWTDELPPNLQAQVKSLVEEYPKSESVLSQLVAHFNTGGNEKRRKINSGKSKQVQKHSTAIHVKTEASGGPTKVEVISKHVLNISNPIMANETIFELPGLSFLSPTRRKLNLVFHLFIGENNTPLPVLSVVNPSTSLPDISVTNLSSAIKLCLLVPILGNSTVTSKKDTVMMALWLHDSATLIPGKNEPIICTLNLDSVKKQLMADGKIPEHAEAQISSESDSHAIKPINELIIGFLQRQFSLCGVELINFLPSASPGKNSLLMNDDNVICLSRNANTRNDLVMAGAYKGSKEGAILLVSTADDNAFLIFGFKKPILLMNFTSLKAVSYSNITRFTFSMLVTLVNNEGNEESHEFGMIDQKSFQAIDDFVKKMNVEDNSFDEKHREKRAENKENLNEADVVVGTAEAEVAISDDEEEDGTYTGAAEEEESGSDIDEEFDSNAESGSDDGNSDDEDSDDDEEKGEESAGDV